LNLFGPSDVVVCERTSGESRLRRLDENELGEWLKQYSLAELFDKGVLGGLP
jgi:hypothetical protein